MLLATTWSLMRVSKSAAFRVFGVVSDGGNLRINSGPSDLAKKVRERSGLFVTHTDANTERTLRKHRGICIELVCGGLCSCLV